MHTVGVVGVGNMGQAIASESLRTGCTVWIFDRDLNRLQRAFQELIEEQAARRCGSQISPRGRLFKATQPADVADADLVIEAVSEDLLLKRAVLQELDQILKPNGVLATNTSSIPLAALANGIHLPERFCGLHFCHPVAERKLVEVIQTPRTQHDALQFAELFVRRLSKTPIRVGDGPGFVLNRLLSIYLNESLELLLEGVEPAQLNDAARNLGMPQGPLVQLDRYGLQVSVGVGRTMLMAFPERWIPSELLIAVFQAQRRQFSVTPGFLVQRDGAVSSTGSSPLRPLVREIIASRRRAVRHWSEEEITRRCWLPVFLEATRILTEGLADDPRQIETILELGLGATASFRGPFQWADQQGASQILHWSNQLQHIGQRFSPTPWLMKKVGRRVA